MSEAVRRLIDLAREAALELPDGHIVLWSRVVDAIATVEAELDSPFVRMSRDEFMKLVDGDIEGTR